MRSLVLLAGIAVATAACGLTTSISTLSGGMSCEDVPSGACDEQAALVTAGLAGVSEVTIKCRAAPPCTRAGGGGTAEIRLKNGQKLTRAWSYVGDPGPAPVVKCVGLGQNLCMKYLQSELDGIPPSKHIVSATMTCTSATCTEASGETKVTILLGDGTQRDSGVGWSGS